MENVMPEPQTPIEAPLGTTSTDAPKRKRGRPKKIQPETVPEPQPKPELEDVAAVLDLHEIKCDEWSTDIELQEIRARLDVLEAKVGAKTPSPADTRTNLERAKARSRLREEARKALSK